MWDNNYEDWVTGSKGLVYLIAGASRLGRDLGGGGAPPFQSPLTVSSANVFVDPLCVQ